MAPPHLSWKFGVESTGVFSVRRCVVEEIKSDVSSSRLSPAVVRDMVRNPPMAEGAVTVFVAEELLVETDCEVVKLSMRLVT